MAREFQQAPGKGELWRVGNTHYVAYSTPKTSPPVWQVWRVEDNEQLDALVGVEGDKTPDRTLTNEQFRRIGALDFGVSSELSNFDEDPTAQLERDFAIEANVQPWLRDPEVMAYIVGAIREGREVTRAELAQTEYWKTHSAEERDWMVLRATDPRAAKVQEADHRRTVKRMLREAGVSDAPEELVRLLAGRWVGGRWSESFVTDQIRGLADPYGSDVELAPEVIETARGYDPSAGDASAVAGGADAVRERVRAIFENRGVDIAIEDEDEATRLDRITDEVMNGRAISDVRRAIDQQAGLSPITGRDITRAREDEVRALAMRWLGPEVGNLDDAKVRDWAGRMRNDPDAEIELTEALKKQRQTMFKNYDENLTYNDIVEPVRNIAVNIWGQPIQDEMMLVDLANMDDYTAMQAKLRKEGLKRGIANVTQSVASDINKITGGSVRASAL